MAGYNDSEGPYTQGAAGASTHLTHITDITNKFDKDATPATYDSLVWDGTVYVPTANLVNAKNFGAVGNDTADDTTALQNFITHCITNHKQGYIPPGTYKITSALAFSSQPSWQILGAGSNIVTIKQYTNNTAVFNLGSDAVSTLSTWRISGLTLDYSSSQASTNTNANPILFSQMAFQFRLQDIKFNRGSYAIRVLSGIGGPWGGSWDDLRFFDGLTAGAMDWTGALNAVPNNHWGRFFVDATNMVGPIFNNLRGYNFVIDTIEIINANLGPKLMMFSSSVNIQIGSVKCEIGTFTTNALGLFEFNSDGSAHIGELNISNNIVVNVPAGTITLLKTGTGGAGPASHGGRIIVDRIVANLTTLTAGNAYLVQTASPHTIEIGSVNFSGGWELQNTTSTLTAEQIVVRHFLNNRMVADRGDANYTVALGDPNINRFATPFTAQRTITLPVDNNIFNGLYYELVFDGAIMGANTALIKAGATTLTTLTADGVYRWTWTRNTTPASGWLRSHSGDSGGTYEVPPNWFPTYKTGSYYLPHSSGSGQTSNTLVNNTLRLLPLVITKRVQIVRVGADFSAAGEANSVYRIGIYADDGAGLPTGAALLDAGSISTGTGNAGTVATGGTPGVYEITVAITLAPGLYWFGGVVQGAPTTQPTMRTVNPAVLTNSLPLAAIPSANVTVIGFSMTGASGALPTWSGTTTSGSGPRLFYRVA